MNRREFMIGTGLAMGAALGAQAESRFTTISYNVLACRGYPETKKNREQLLNDRPLIPKHTGEALKKYAPDLVTLQEAPSEAKVAEIADALDMSYAFFPGGWPGNDDYPGGFPGAVITKHEIIEQETRPTAGAAHPARLFTRHLGRAKLMTPFGPLHVVSTHFHASDHDARMDEAAAIVALIEKLHESAPIILLGDLNHEPADPEYAIWTGAGLKDIGHTQGVGDTPTFSSAKPRIRIDYIWATAELAEKATRAEVLHVPPFTPASSDGATYGLSDHIPVLAEFHIEE